MATNTAKPTAGKTVVDIFSNTSLGGLPASIKKSNDVVYVRVNGTNQFTVTVKQLWTALIFYSQRPDLLEPPPPPSREVPNPESLYWIRSTALYEVLGLTGRNFETVYKNLKILSEAKIETLSNTAFSMLQFISNYVYLPGSGRRPNLIGWEFPSAYRTHIINPKEFTTEPLCEVLSMTHHNDMVLYTIALKCLKGPGGLTVKRPWKVWYEMLTGMPVGSAEAYIDKYGQVDGYRYFRRDVIVPAMAGCWRRHLAITMLETNRGDEISIQFAVGKVADTAKTEGKKAEWSLVGPSPTEEEMVQAELALRAMLQEQAALPAKDIKRLVNRYGVNRVYRNFKYMTEVVKSEKESKMAYLMSSCESDYAKDYLAKKNLELEAEPTPPDFIDVDAIELGQNTTESLQALLKAKKLATKIVVPSQKALAARVPNKRETSKREVALRIENSIRLAQASLDFSDKSEAAASGVELKEASARPAAKRRLNAGKKSALATAVSGAVEPVDVVPVSEMAASTVAEESPGARHERLAKEKLQAEAEASKVLSDKYKAYFETLSEAEQLIHLESFKKAYPRAVRKLWPLPVGAAAVFYSKYLPSVVAENELGWQSKKRSA